MSFAKETKMDSMHSPAFPPSFQHHSVRRGRTTKGQIVKGTAEQKLGSASRGYGPYGALPLLLLSPDSPPFAALCLHGAFVMHAVRCCCTAPRDGRTDRQTDREREGSAHGPIKFALNAGE